MMRLSQRSALFPLLALGLLVASGCGGGRAPVKGKVTWNGTPVDNGTIGFVPKASGVASVSGPITNGTYSIPSDKGPVAGDYQVQITWEKKTGKKVSTPGDSGTTVDEVRQLIPDMYNTRTTLTATINSGENTLDFDLKGTAGSSSGGGTAPRGLKD